MSRILIAAIVFCLLCSAPLLSQEARGSISGRIADSSGAVIPNAKVAVTNTLTNETRRANTNDTGYYEINFLDPSTYSVTVEAQGFKKTFRSGIEVNVSARLDISFTLEIGGVAETVEVKGEAPLLETTTASGGRVLDNRQLINLPFSDLNPFALSALAPGMQWTGQPEYRRPFDNGGTSSFNTAGGVGQNEYSIDGVTVTGTSRRVGFTPPADSITEFKLETSNFDASQGFSSGAAINVVSRSGNNQLHGSLFDQHWQQRLNATPHFSRLLWEDQVAKGKISPDSQKQAPGRSNNYGFTVSGPVVIPKVFNGRDKLFWTFTYNGIKQAKAETTDSINRTVPTMLMRQGDFSELLNAPNGANLYTVYDPRSARLSGSNVVRDPFPGNRIPLSLVPSKTYEPYVKIFPVPNNVPGLVSQEFFNNYYAVNMPKNENFKSIVNRYDWVLGDKHRLNGRWQWNDRLANEYDWTYETALGLHGNGLTRINRGGVFGWLYTINPNNVLDAGGGVSRFEEGSRAIPGVSRTDFKPSSVGLPGYLDQKAGSYTELPRLDFNNITDVSDSYPVVGAKASTYDVHATMTTIKGAHTWKYGWQERRMDGALMGPGNSSGIFTFRNNYVRKSDNDNVSSSHGLDWATFMLGLPTSVSIDSNDSQYLRTPRRAFFFQDDWRLSSKLRLSFGLRYERESGNIERYNRGIVGSFFPDLKLPFTDQVQTAYASNPIPELAASNFKVLGGTRYLGQDGYDSVTKGVNWWLPKVGVVYSFDNKTVLRAGYGMYADTYNINNSQPDATGYSLPTATVLTTDNGLTFCCGVGAAGNLSASANVFADPFPVRSNGTRFDAPLQNQLGYIARVGRGFNSGNYALGWDFKPALQNRWRIGVQREVFRNLMLEVSYNGSYASTPQQYRLDALPQQFWSTGNVRNQAVDDNMNANVPNPFNIKNLASLQQSSPVIYNYLATQGLFTGTTIRKNQLLRPYGFMSDVRGTNNDSRGYTKYHDLSFLVERRFTAGFTGSFMYTWASSYSADWLMNEFQTSPSERINNNVMPHRIAVTGTYELPWGKGRTWLKSGPLAYIAGGWNLGGVFQLQSGPATGDWGNRFFYGNMDDLPALFNHDAVHSNDMHQWFDPNIVYRGTGAVPAGFTGFDGRSSAQPGSYQVRTFPIRLDAVRADGINNIDAKIERMFDIKAERGMRFRLSVDLLNALNHTNFSGPNLDPTSSNFGKVTSQRGLSRIIQFNGRFEF